MTQRYYRRWRVRVIDGPHAGREFIAMSSDCQEAVDRVKRLIGIRDWTIAANAGVFDSVRGVIIEPGIE